MHTLQKKLDLNPKPKEQAALITFGQSLSPVLFRSLIVALFGLVLAIAFIWTDHPVIATLTLVFSIVCVLFGSHTQQRTITINQSQRSYNNHLNPLFPRPITPLTLINTGII